MPEPLKMTSRTFPNQLQPILAPSFHTDSRNTYWAFVLSTGKRGSGSYVAHTSKGEDVSTHRNSTRQNRSVNTAAQGAWECREEGLIRIWKRPSGEGSLWVKLWAQAAAFHHLQFPPASHLILPLPQRAKGGPGRKYQDVRPAQKMLEANLAQRVFRFSPASSSWSRPTVSLAEHQVCPGFLHSASLSTPPHLQSCEKVTTFS